MKRVVLFTLIFLAPSLHAAQAQPAHPDAALDVVTISPQQRGQLVPASGGGSVYYDPEGWYAFTLPAGGTSAQVEGKRAFYFKLAGKTYNYMCQVTKYPEASLAPFSAAELQESLAGLFAQTNAYEKMARDSGAIAERFILPLGSGNGRIALKAATWNIKRTGDGLEVTMATVMLPKGVVAIACNGGYADGREIVAARLRMGSGGFINPPPAQAAAPPVVAQAVAPRPVTPAAVAAPAPQVAAAAPAPATAGPLPYDIKPAPAADRGVMRPIAGNAAYGFTFTHEQGWYTFVVPAQTTTRVVDGDQAFYFQIRGGQRICIVHTHTQALNQPLSQLQANLLKKSVPGNGLYDQVAALMTIREAIALPLGGAAGNYGKTPVQVMTFSGNMKNDQAFTTMAAIELPAGLLFVTCQASTAAQGRTIIANALSIAEGALAGGSAAASVASNAPPRPAAPAPAPVPAAPAPRAAAPATASASGPPLTPIRLGQTIEGRLGQGSYRNPNGYYGEDYEVSAPPGTRIDVAYASKQLLASVAVGVDADDGCRAACQDAKNDTVDLNKTVRGFVVPASGKVRIKLYSGFPGADGPFSLAVLPAGGAAAAIAQQVETVIELGQTLKGELTAADPQLPDGRAYDVYMLEAQTPGSKVQITAKSAAFSTMMVAGPLVIDGKCTSLDPQACKIGTGGLGEKNSRLTLAVPASGYLWITVTGLTAFAAKGAYTIELVKAP